MSTVENPLETPVVENPFVETPFTDVGAEVQRAAADPPPPIYAAMAGFAEPDELLAAVREVRARGYTQIDTLTPFPVHGMDEAMGLGRSRLGWLVLMLGATGAGSALLLQWWTGAVDYPLVVGGKPLFAIEFAVPVTFELLVLFAAFAAVFGMLAWNGLPRLDHPVFDYGAFRGATDDRFVLVIERDDDCFDERATPELLRDLGGRDVELVET